MLSLKQLMLLPTLAQALTYKGVDWSSVAVEEASGISYSTADGTTTPLEDILVANGVNIVRQRIWTASGDYDLDYNLKLAARAQAAGLDVYLDLHFSDTWADPSHQAIPSGWPSEVGALAGTLYNYTMEVANAFASAGIAPAIVSIGNEITSGMLLPTGSADDSPAGLAQLLHSAAWGIKDSDLATQPKIMIHTDNGWNWDTQKWFYDLILSQSGEGALTSSDFDMIGVS